MRCSLFTTIAFVASAAAAQAHEAPAHEHARLIPIPAYSQPHGSAGGAAALEAAQALLASFDEAARETFVFELDARERSAWSNLPARMVPRAGIPVGEVSDPQRRLLFEFLASSLGEAGYRVVAAVMAAEGFLSADRRAGRQGWAAENYWLSFFGTPSAGGQWGWQFGGHHLGLNVSIDGGKITSMSPSFIGAEPAVFTFNGADYEVAVDMHRAGYAVFQALDGAQKRAADARRVPRRVVAGPGTDGRIPDPIGLSAAEMSTEQRDLLLEAIGKWVALQPAENAKPRMVAIKSELDRIRFAWTGTDAVNAPCYMRMQGPSLIIELLSTGRNVGVSASGQGHYHTVYRNPALEYGGVEIDR